MIPVIYENLCPVCNGDVGEEEIAKGICFFKKIPLSSFYHSKDEEEIEKLFEKVIGKPRDIQRFWIRRIADGESFAAVAPTGIGKTVFGLVVSLFFAIQGKKSYLLVPTKVLADQCLDNLERFCKSIGKKIGINSDGDIRIAFYHGGMKRKDKRDFLEILKEEKFDIMITTTQFLSKNFSLIKDKIFDFIFVDDVDAILKGSKNVDKILVLLGFRKFNGKWKGDKKGILMVSTATAKKGRATLLFRELLNFDVGSSFFTIRSIDDIYVGDEELDDIKKIMRQMGKGAIIYTRTSEEAERYYELLKKDFNIGIAISRKRNDYEMFERGEVDFLIGTASYYGTLIRGLDLPYKIRYVIFIGVPSIKTDFERVTPSMLKILALSFRKNEKVREFIPVLSKLDRDRKRFEELKEIIREISQEEKSDDIVISEGKIIFPDIRTYIQGSGRSSRLTEMGLTRGASFIFENNRDLIEAFRKRASFYDIEIKEMDEVDIERIKREIDRSRVKGEYRDLIKPAMLIVESPTKAKLISRFFGKPSVKIYGNIVTYEIPTENYILLVTACLGHVVDLSTDRGFYGVNLKEDGFIPVYSSIKRCRKCNYQYTREGNCPRCGSNDILDSKNRIEDLRKLASKVSLVIVGTDPDAEGEKIAWDLYNFLSPLTKIRRAEFHEITPRAIREALNSLRSIDVNRVRAQIVRRIEDRWIGFILSQRLWKVFNKTNLSAGRVQTPVLDWIIEQEKKYRNKRKISILLDLDVRIDRDIGKEEVYIEVEVLSEKEENRVSPPPYTTDELLKDAGRILKLSSPETMRLAQDLFENGLITYHRTDSTRVSDVGLRIAKEYLGEEFKGRTWGTDKESQGAHECIRPTRAWDRYMIQKMMYEKVISTESIDRKHLALYDLIFRRFMASQCREFRVRIKRYRIRIDGIDLEEERVVDAKGRAFDLYKSVIVKKDIPTGRYKTRVEIRIIPEDYPYTQADIVRLMKEKGLGRPSTYATIIEKLFERRYIYEKRRYLFSTILGRKVNRFLKTRYQDFISEERTRYLYERIDEIESGERDYIETLRELYNEIKNI